MPPWPISRIIL
jgi:hypothetical protein